MAGAARAGGLGKSASGKNAEMLAFIYFTEWAKVSSPDAVGGG